MIHLQSKTTCVPTTSESDCRLKKASDYKNKMHSDETDSETQIRLQKIRESIKRKHSYTLKTSGLKNPGHLKMTQFGSNILLLTRFLVKFRGNFTKKLATRILGQEKKQNGGARRSGRKNT